MTREDKRIEEIGFASEDFISFDLCETPFPEEEQEFIEYCFATGAQWADENPQSPWISVKDDLPCNHKELILSSGYYTVSVFTYKKGGAVGIDNMIIRNGKWEWEAWKENYLYWMPIPNLPKE